MDNSNTVITLLKEQNKRLNALQRIESNNNMMLNYISGNHNGVYIDKWGHHNNYLSPNN